MLGPGEIAKDSVTVALVPGLTLEQDQAADGLPGTMVAYQHTLTNLSNGYETFHLSASSSEGWSVSVHPAGVGLAQGESAAVMVYVSIPTNGMGVTDIATVTAESATDSAISASLEDQTTGYAWPYNIYLPLTVR